MTIGEFARAGDVSTSLVRYYEAQAVLPPPRRCGNARRYDQDDLARLESILVARRLGFSLGQIRELVARPSALRDIVSERAAAVDAIIRKARVIRALLRHASFHGTLQPKRYWEILARVSSVRTVDVEMNPSINSSLRIAASTVSQAESFEVRPR